MDLTIETQFNIGDVVYVADHYYDFYANHKPYIIKDVLIDINNRRTHIQYEVEQDNFIYRVPEAWVFSSYEKCARWCEEHN